MVRKRRTKQTGSTAESFEAPQEAGEGWLVCNAHLPSSKEGIREVEEAGLPNVVAVTVAAEWLLTSIMVDLVHLSISKASITSEVTSRGIHLAVVEQLVKLYKRVSSGKKTSCI